MGPRTTRQAVAPPSGGIATAVEGEGVAEAETAGGMDGDASTVLADDVDEGADADGSGGPAFPGDPLHAVRTAKTSHHGARTLLLYYA